MFIETIFDSLEFSNLNACSFGSIVQASLMLAENVNAL